MADGFLTEIIRRNYNAARMNPGTPARETLRGGLRIGVVVTLEDGGEKIGLHLDRTGGVAPSLEEWKTVLRHWPWAVNANQPPARAYLVGEVAARKKDDGSAG